MANRSTIVVEDNIAEWAEDLEREGGHGLEAAGRIAQTSIRAKMTRRGPEGVGVTPDSHVQDSISVSPVMRRRKGAGLEVWVYSPDPNALWQDQGTRGKRGKATTARTAARRREQGIAHSGVKGLRFFSRGLRDAWPACERALAVAMGRARP